MKKTGALLLAALLLFTLIGCQSTPSGSKAPGKGLIGISLPSDYKPSGSRRWEQDGQDIKQQLEAKGYAVELLYADQYGANQASQIKELTAQGCKVLIVADFGASSLDSELAQAKAAGATVIAYDRPIPDTANVDYYVAFDIFRYGAVQGEYIEHALGLKDGKGPFNIELFTGDSSDGNIGFYFEGAMSVLRPYIQSGRLVVKSGQTDLTKVCTYNYDSEKAKARMDDLLTQYYAHDKLDAVLATTDSIAIGIIASLEDAGYTKFPVITGMDCDQPNVIAMKAGKQAMSVFRDTHILAAKVVEMADDILTGREVPLTVTTGHISNGITFSMGFTGAKAVPSFLCDPAVVTAGNIQEILIAGGYYTEADLAPPASQQ